MDIEFAWHENYVNGIKENGVSCWWCIGTIGTLSRFYKIVPFSKTNTDGVMLKKNTYFLLYEGNYEKSDSEADFENFKPIRLSEIAVYEDLESAKKRAVTQLKVINNLIKTFCPKEE